MHLRSINQNFDRDDCTGFVVECTDDTAKSAGTKGSEDFITIGKMVADLRTIAVVRVVESAVQGIRRWVVYLSSPVADEVNLRKIKDFCGFVTGKKRGVL
jgi:hypothetical protein